MEQKEEINKTCTWLDRIDSFGTDKVALRMLDEEMGKA
jgi:ferritin